MKMESRLIPTPAADTYHPLLICDHPEWTDKSLGLFAAIQFVSGKFVRLGDIPDEEAAKIFLEYGPPWQGQSITFDFLPAGSTIEKNTIALSRAMDGSFIREATHPVDEPVWTLLEAILDRQLSATSH